MRRKLVEQLGLVTTTTDHVRARELEMMSQILDQMPQALDLVHGDLLSGSGKADTGRDAMTAELVLRAMVIKQRFGVSYEQLAFEIADSTSVRKFCRVPPSVSPPTKSTLQRNVKRVAAGTWEKVNRLLIGYAQQNKIESGRKTRTDCTVVETHIHEPSDSSLLWDCVRVLCRLMTQARETFGIPFRSRRRRAKRRAMGILNAKSREQRAALYRDLLKVTEETMVQARHVAEQLRDVKVDDVSQMVCAMVTEQGIKDVLERPRAWSVRPSAGCCEGSRSQPPTRSFRSSSHTPTSSSRTGARRFTVTRSV
jgi:transposase, IS5 family